MTFKKNNILKNLKCPHCGNDKILIYIDFKNQRFAYGICKKTIIKSIIRRPTKTTRTKGCGKEFKLKIKPKELKWQKS